MVKDGILKHSAHQSILGEASVINPESESRKKSILADLLLTALIDAFSILVIFLLMSFSSTGEILFVGKEQLPKSAQGDILERTPVVKIADDKIFVEEKEVPINELTAAFLDLRKKFQEIHGPEAEYPAAITIQADRRLKYENFISQVVAAAAQAGMSDIKFAVTMQ